MLSHNQYTKNVSYPDFPLLGLIEDTLWLFNIAMDNGPWFSMAMLNNQMVDRGAISMLRVTRISTCDEPVIPFV